MPKACCTLPAEALLISMSCWSPIERVINPAIVYPNAQQYSIELAPGDVIMAATDGLWDNVFDAEAAQLLHSVAGRSHTPAAAANTLAQFAHMRCDALLSLLARWRTRSSACNVFSMQGFLHLRGMLHVRLVLGW